MGARGRRFKSYPPDVQVNLNIKKGEEFIWSVARAHAKAEGITLSELVRKAILLYVTRNNTILRD